MSAALALPTDDYAREVLAAGRLLVGAAVPTGWRPVDATMRMIVDAIDDDVHAHGGLPDVVRVAELLRSRDRETPWCSLLLYLLDRFDEVTDRSTHGALTLTCARLVRKRHAELQRAVSALLRARDAVDAARDAFAEAVDLTEQAARLAAGDE